MKNPVVLRLIKSIKSEIKVLESDYKRCKSIHTKNAIVEILDNKDEMLEQLKECI